jgi:hypothetical protein
VDSDDDRDGDRKDDDLCSFREIPGQGKSGIFILSTELYSLQTKFLPEPGKKRKQSRKVKKLQDVQETTCR